MLLLLALLAQYQYNPPKPPFALEQYTTTLPAAPSPLTRVEVFVYDEPKIGGVQVLSAQFNNINIPLKPRDLQKYRGSASYQLKPGQYELDWRVQKDKINWPRTVDHKQMFQIQPGEFTIHITIEGDQASMD